MLILLITMMKKQVIMIEDDLLSRQGGRSCLNDYGR